MSTQWPESVHWRWKPVFGRDCWVSDPKRGDGWKGVQFDVDDAFGVGGILFRNAPFFFLSFVIRFLEGVSDRTSLVN